MKIKIFTTDTGKLRVELERRNGIPHDDRVCADWDINALGDE